MTPKFKLQPLRPMPTATWTHYGRWSSDGLYVYSGDKVIYTHPAARYLAGQK